jgi:hypothetical protein
MDILYVLCYWYSLAKMHLHSKHSVNIFWAATVELGIQLRRFESSICAKYASTKETSREVAKRVRDAQARAKRRGVAITVDSTPRNKSFNLCTVKAQAIADYPFHIEECGSLDSYDTRVVSYSDFSHCPPNSTIIRVKFSTKW